MSRTLETLVSINNSKQKVLFAAVFVLPNNLGGMLLNCSFIPRTVVQCDNLPQDVENLHELNPFKESIKNIDLTLDGPMYRY